MATWHIRKLFLNLKRQLGDNITKLFIQSDPDGDRATIPGFSEDKRNDACRSIGRCPHGDSNSGYCLKEICTAIFEGVALVWRAPFYDDWGNYGQAEEKLGRMVQFQSGQIR